MNYYISLIQQSCIDIDKLGSFDNGLENNHAWNLKHNYLRLAKNDACTYTPMYQMYSYMYILEFL